MQLLLSVAEFLLTLCYADTFPGDDKNEVKYLDHMYIQISLEIVPWVSVLCNTEVNNHVVLADTFHGK